MGINKNDYDLKIQALPGFKKALDNLNEFHKSMELIKQFPPSNSFKEFKDNTPYTIEEFKYN